MLMNSDAVVAMAAAGPGPGPGPDAPTAVIVGGGFGGLSAAVRLGARGYRVTVLERLDSPGGRACLHRRDGHTFHAGPTIVTVPFLFEELWAMAGRRLADDVTLVPIDPLYRIRFPDGEVFDYSGDPEHMRAEARRISPTAAAGQQRFMQDADRCCRLGSEALGCKAFDSLGDLLRAFPAFARLQVWRSPHGEVARHIRHPKLRATLSLQSLRIGGNPFSVTAAYSLINSLERRFGVHWAMGGTDRATTAEPYRLVIAEALERTVLPGLRQHITTSFMTTPQDVTDRLLSCKGAAFGLEPLLLQIAWFRPHHRSKDSQNLFMVFASAHPGAGAPGVMMSAKALDTVMPHAAALPRRRAAAGQATSLSASRRLRPDCPGRSGAA